MVNKTSLALISIAIVGVSVGALLLQKWRNGQADNQERGEVEKLESDNNQHKLLLEAEAEKTAQQRQPAKRSLTEDEQQKIVKVMEDIEKEFILSIDAMLSLHAIIQKKGQGMEVESEVKQLTSLDTRQRQLMAAMKQLGGEAATEKLRQTAVWHIQAKEAADNMDTVKTIAAQNLGRAQLAHHIQHNPEFQIQKETSPLKKKIEAIAKQAYWDAVAEKLTNNEHGVFIDLLQTCNLKLIQLSGGRLKDEHVVDISLICQMLGNSKRIDAVMLQDILEIYVITIKRLDSPNNDKHTEDWLKVSLEQLHTCTEEAMCIHAIPQFFQWLLDKMDAIEMAVMNYKVQQIKPFLQAHGTEYVRAKFDDSLAQEDMEHSKEWIQQVMDIEKAKAELDFTKIGAGDSVSTLAFIVRAIVQRISTKGSDGNENCHGQVIPELLSLEKDPLLDFNKRWTIVALSICMAMRLKQVLQMEGVPLKNVEEEKTMKESIMRIISENYAKADKSNLRPVVEDVTDDALETQGSSVIDASKEDVKEDENMLEQKITMGSPEKQGQLEKKNELTEHGTIEARQKQRHFIKIVIPKVLSETEMAELCVDQFLQFAEEFKRQRKGPSVDISNAGRATIRSMVDPKDKIRGIVTQRLRSAIVLQVTQEVLRTNNVDPGSSECRQKLGVIGAVLFEEEVVGLAKCIASLVERTSKVHASHYNRLIGEALRASISATKII